MRAEFGEDRGVSPEMDDDRMVEPPGTRRVEQPKRRLCDSTGEVSAAFTDMLIIEDAYRVSPQGLIRSR